MLPGVIGRYFRTGKPRVVAAIKIPTMHGSTWLKCLGDVLHTSRWCRDRVTVLTHRFNVKRNGFTNKLKGFRFCITSRNTPVQIENVCRPAVTGLFEHYCVFLRVHSNFACLSSERTVPIARSLLGWPEPGPSSAPDAAITALRVPKLTARKKLNLSHNKRDRIVSQTMG